MLLKGWGSINEMLSDFDIDKPVLDGFEVIYGLREYGSYDGWAFVLLLKDREVYTVDGSHCSCNGLERQWQPLTNSIAALRMRKDLASVEFSEVLDQLEARLCRD